MYSAISNDQAKSVINSEQLLAAYKDALAKSVEYAGGMHWKTIAGKQYLYRTTDGKSNAKSLGVRSEQTERILATFTERKARGVAREAELKDRLAIQAKVNSAYRVGHVPNNV